MSIIRKIATAKSMSLEEILSIVTKLLAFDIMTKEIAEIVQTKILYHVMQFSPCNREMNKDSYKCYLRKCPKFF